MLSDSLASLADYSDLSKTILDRASDFDQYSSSSRANFLDLSRSCSELDAGARDLRDYFKGLRTIPREDMAGFNMVTGQPIHSALFSMMDNIIALTKLELEDVISEAAIIQRTDDYLPRSSPERLDSEAITARRAAALKFYADSFAHLKKDATRLWAQFKPMFIGLLESLSLNDHPLVELLDRDKAEYVNLAQDLDVRIVLAGLHGASAKAQ